MEKIFCKKMIEYQNAIGDEERIPVYEIQFECAFYKILFGYEFEKLVNYQEFKKLDLAEQ